MLTVHCQCLSVTLLESYRAFLWGIAGGHITALSTFHDKNDNNDKVSINLCQSLSWATFQIPCHSCHLCHSPKGNRYNYPFVMNTGSGSTGKWACQWPIGLPQKTTDSGYQCPNPICVTAWLYIRRHRGWLMPRPMKLQHIGLQSDCERNCERFRACWQWVTDT